MKYQSARGTQDILPKDSTKWQKIIDISKEILEFFSYKEIIIPVFEHTELFQRSVGESSDIVNKEMYTFLDRSDRSLTLRPEATAGIVRSYIENGLHRETKPVKLWTYGPMFRYERPQAGRFRQFHQIDAEALGNSSISSEVELMLLASMLFNKLKIDYTLEINSLGDKKSKENYKEYFEQYVKDFLTVLCDDCKRRYEQNPLRMLDCKVEEDQAIYTNAKKPLDYLSNESAKRWEEITSIFKYNNNEYPPFTKVNPNLVRGLDYYNDFVFEIKSIDPILKRQSTICAGGRYDGLVESLGGPPTPGFGWAIGIERIKLIFSEAKQEEIKLMFLANQKDIVFSILSFYECMNLKKDNLKEEFRELEQRLKGDKPIEENLKNLKLGIEIEKMKLLIELNYNPHNIAKQIESADKKGFDFVLFYLNEEKSRNIFKIKNLKTREEKECKDTAVDLLNTLFGEVNKVKN